MKTHKAYFRYGGHLDDVDRDKSYLSVKRLFLLVCGNVGFIVVAAILELCVCRIAIAKTQNFRVYVVLDSTVVEFHKARLSDSEVLIEARSFGGSPLLPSLLELTENRLVKR